MDEDDADRLQVWVHPSWRLMGGEFDPDTGRVVRGGEWQERVEETIDATEADTAAVALKIDREQDRTYEDGDSPTHVRGPHTDIPYGDGWDEIVEDSNRGDVSREAVDDLIAGYDRVTVCGGYFTGCERRFASVVAAVADEQDGETEIRIDGENSFRHDGFDMAGSDRPRDRRLEEQAAAQPAPPAASDGSLIASIADEYDDVDAVEVRPETNER